MTANIKDIVLWKDNPDKTRTSEIVRVNFNFPCTWTTFTIEELKQIIRLWIKTEEKRYPVEKGYKGRELLKQEIDKVFKEV